MNGTIQALDVLRLITPCAHRNLGVHNNNDGTVIINGRQFDNMNDCEKYLMAIDRIDLNLKKDESTGCVILTLADVFRMLPKKHYLVLTRGEGSVAPQVLHWSDDGAINYGDIIVVPTDSEELAAHGMNFYQLYRKYVGQEPSDLFSSPWFKHPRLSNELEFMVIA